MRLPQSPPSSHDLFARRGHECAETCFSDKYQALVREAQHKHLHWDRLRFLARHYGLDPELAWFVISTQRQSLYKTLPSLNDKAGQPLRFIATDAIQRDLSVIDQQFAGRIDFAGGKLSESEGARAIHAALQEEAISSSMLEGAATTRREAKDMLRENRIPRTRGERMVMNNWRAIEMVRAQRKTPLTPEFVIELQRMLTRDTLDRPDEVGRLRTQDDAIVVEDRRTGEVIHTPPDAETLAERLAAMCLFANGTMFQNETFIHPVVRAIALHFQLGYDHPFCDGNGRTARALFYWSMLNQGYWMAEYLPISRLIYAGPAKYAAAFLYTETDAADLTYFLQYHLKIIHRAADDLTLYVQRQRDKVRELAKSRRPLRLRDRQWDALRWMRDNPAQPVDVARYQELASVSYGTARTDLLDLEARGLARKMRISRKFVYFPSKPKD